MDDAPPEVVVMRSIKDIARAVAERRPICASLSHAIFTAPISTDEKMAIFERLKADIPNPESWHGNIDDMRVLSELMEETTC